MKPNDDRANDYFMPSEWAARSCTWLTWPHNKDTWPHFFSKAQRQYAAMVAAISLDEPCHILLDSSLLESDVRKMLCEFSYDDSNIHILHWNTNDSWIRDYGPIFLNRCDKHSSILPKQKVLSFRYNAWGGKYPPFDRDQEVSQQIAGRLSIPIVRSDITLEGGALEVDGNGIVLTTDYCALNKNRNPQYSKHELTERLKNLLGAKDIWWIPGKPIQGDDTDGHIDQIARFTPSRTILFSHQLNSNSQDYENGQQNYQALIQNCEGSNYSVVQLPVPNEIKFGGQSIPASYTNYYITKNCILVPQFDDPSDTAALEIIQSQFPNHQAKPLGSRFLSDGLGSFHCLTQQQPCP